MININCASSVHRTNHAVVPKCVLVIYAMSRGSRYRSLYEPAYPSGYTRIGSTISYISYVYDVPILNLTRRIRNLASQASYGNQEKIVNNFEA